MSRSVPRTALIAGLVLLAGCNGLFGPTGNTAGSDGGTTPRSATPGEPNGGYGTTRAPGELPPGMTHGGIRDPWRLAQAHAAVLRNTSYTVTSASTNWFPNGTLATQQAMTSRSGANGTRSASVRMLSGPGLSSPENLARYDAWTNGSAAYVRTELTNGTVEYARWPGFPTVRDPTGRDTLYGLYATYEFTVADQFERGGTTYYRLVSTELGPNATTPFSNASVSILLDERGVVREYHVSGEKTAGSETFLVDRTVRFSALGNTTVGRPAWLDEALRNTTDAPSRD